MARKSTFKAFKNDAIYAGLRAAAALGRRLSLDRARRWGRRTGALAWRVVPRERKKALRTLAVAFPDLSPAERAAIARRAFEHLGVSLFEIAWLPNLDRGAFETTTRWEHLDRFRRAADLGRGVVLFTGHCGNWEWMAAAIALAGFRMNVVARQIYDPRVNDFIVASRAAFGVQSIGRGSSAAAREILQTLRAGAVLGVLIDQNIKVEAAQVPFFGVPAPTPIGPARLAIRSGAVAIAGFIRREPDGTQVIRFEEPVETREDDDPVELTAAMTRAIEEQIRRVPEQWVWMHDRWRVRAR
ncbi:MAG: lysophospholipid acyltransferase family protein [Thermoanaerobaculia bacterium]